MINLTKYIGSFAITTIFLLTASASAETKIPEVKINENQNNNQSLNLSSPSVEQQKKNDKEYKALMQKKAGRDSNWNKAEPILPEECTLKSYTFDGTHALYVCGKDKKQIVTIMVFPDDNTTATTVVERMKENYNCRSTGDKTEMGYLVICPASDGDYVNYIEDSASKIIAIVTAPADYANADNLAKLQNLGLAIYFFRLQVARDEKQIEYLTNLLNSANMVDKEQGEATLKDRKEALKQESIQNDSTKKKSE